MGVDELLSRCRWPELGEPYASALREAVAYIVDRFEPIGIVAAGTIVRGAPDPASDLDICVIHRAPFRQRLQRRFHGVPAEIFVNTPKSVRRYLEQEHAGGRPSLAHMLTTGFVVLAADPVVEALRAEAAEGLANPPTPAPGAPTPRYGAATLYEDAVDVAARDPETAALLLAQAVPPMLHYHFRAAGRFVPRNKDLLAELARLDPEVAALARRFFATARPEERLELAGAIADRTIGARGFFEWESNEDPEEF